VVFCVVALYSVVAGYKRFGLMYCLHLQPWRWRQYSPLKHHVNFKSCELLPVRSHLLFPNNLLWLICYYTIKQTSFKLSKLDSFKLCPGQYGWDKWNQILMYSDWRSFIKGRLKASTILNDVIHGFPRFLHENAINLEIHYDCFINIQSFLIQQYTTCGE
jgi:hypothetical protein